MNKIDSPGSAEILSDGTLVLHLRADDGVRIGDASFSFSPSDPKYMEMMQYAMDKLGLST